MNYFPVLLHFAVELSHETTEDITNIQLAKNKIVIYKNMLSLPEPEDHFQVFILHNFAWKYQY